MIGCLKGCRYSINALQTTPTPPLSHKHSECLCARSTVHSTMHAVSSVLLEKYCSAHYEVRSVTNGNALNSAWMCMPRYMYTLYIYMYNVYTHRQVRQCSRHSCDRHSEVVRTCATRCSTRENAFSHSAMKGWVWNVCIFSASASLMALRAIIWELHKAISLVISPSLGRRCRQLFVKRIPWGLLL